jgi:hypothetical protein
MKKTKVAQTIEKFLVKHDLDCDVRIYFNNKCWDYNSDGKKTIIEDIKGSDYCEYANDKTITMTFDGPLYYALNMYNGYELYEKFNSLDFDNHYFELGHAWSCSFYPN